MENTGYVPYQFVNGASIETLDVSFPKCGKHYLLVSEEGTASRRGTDTRTDQTQVRVYLWSEMYCTRDISWTYFHVQTSKFFTDKQGSRSKVSFVQLIRLKDRQEV